MKTTLTAQNLKGNWGTLLLPINSDDSINYQLLNDEIDYLVAAKIDGIYSNGTAGEFHNRQKMNLIRYRSSYHKNVLQVMFVSR